MAAHFVECIEMGRTPDTDGPSALRIVQAGSNATVRGGAVRRASRRGPADRAGHHHALRPGQAVRRSARPRRRRRHPLRRERRRHLRRHARTGRSCGAPASSPRVKEWADRARRRPGRQLCLQRQRLRHAAARRGRPSVRGQPRSAHGADGRRPPVADAPSRRAAGRRQGAVVGLELQKLALAFTHPLLFPYARFDISGDREHPDRRVRPSCAATTAATSIRRRSAWRSPRPDRTVRFLGKKEVFDAPVVGQIASAMGGIRVERGTGSDEPLKAAADALAAGDMVAIMPQGTIPRGIAFFDPVLKGRWGAARLAAMTGAPVIPIGLWGTEKVWPRNARAAQRAQRHRSAARHGARSARRST